MNCPFSAYSLTSTSSLMSLESLKKNTDDSFVLFRTPFYFMPKANLTAGLLFS